MREPTDRFSDRVHDYTRYRPGYPPELLDLLRQARFVEPADLIADIGSGTGKLARLFLEAGHTVIGVEPNEPMRLGARAELRGLSHYHEWTGRAEASGLADGCVDLVTAGQAFHWFDPQQAAVEFLRILRGDARVALIWNDRLQGDGGVMDAYEQLLRVHGTDYAAVRGGRVNEARVNAFFPAGCDAARLDNRQRLDRQALIGRVFSSSFMPAAGRPGHDAARLAFEALFDRLQVDGELELRYDTRLWYGRLR